MAPTPHKKSRKKSPRTHVRSTLSHQSAHKPLHHIDITSSSTCQEGVGVWISASRRLLPSKCCAKMHRSPRRCVQANSLLPRVRTQRSRWRSAAPTRRRLVAKQRPPLQSRLLLNRLAHPCRCCQSHQEPNRLPKLERKLQSIMTMPRFS